jgi:hypothetical protein
MANSTIPNLVAVTVPAVTDLFGVRQSGDTRDKKLTVTQLLTLLPGVTDPLLLNAGAVGAPTYSFSADDDTGVFNVAADQLSLAAGGVEGIRVTEAAAVITLQTFGQIQAPDGTLAAPSISFASSTGTGLMYAGNDRLDIIAAGFLIARADADDEQFLVTSGSVGEPGLVFLTDRNTGIRNAGADQLSLIAGGVEIARATELASNNQFAIIASGSSTVPELTGLADPDTGFRWTGSNEVQFIAANVRSWHFLGGSFFADHSDGPILFNTFGSATVPSICVERGDANTGIGKGANDAVSLIGGGVEGLRIQEALGLVEIDTRGSFIVNNNTLLPPISITAGTDPAADGGDLDLSSGDSGVGATGIGGDVNILSGSSVATTGDGGVVSIKSGVGFFTGAGGDILFEVGAGGAAGPGKSGNFFVNTTVGLTADAGLQVLIPGLTAIYGVGRTFDGPAGDLELWGGYAAGSGGSAVGGDLLLFGGGQGGGSGSGGNAHLYGGESDTQPGFAEVEGGTATVGGPGGQARLLGGPGFGTDQDGGAVVISGGVATGSGVDGTITLTSDGASVSWDGDSLLLPSANDPVTPTLAFGDGDTGFYESSDDALAIAIAGVNTFEFAVNQLRGIAAGTPGLRNVATSPATPNIHPQSSDTDTGLGSPGADAVSLIAGGIEIVRAIESSEDQFIVSPFALLGSAALPSLAFGDGDTGFFEGIDDNLGISIAGTQRWFLSGDSFAANSGGASPAMLNEATSSTNPVFTPRRSDIDTGIGSAVADQLDLIAGGLSCIAVRETAAARQIGFYTSTPVSQSAAYSRAATIVESRALLASASATTLNNNNVLAALIADLQATGLIG